MPDSAQAPLGLFLFWRGFFVFQMLEIEDGVEDQRVAADGFATVERIIGEEQDRSFAEVRCYYCCMLGQQVAVIEQA